MHARQLLYAAVEQHEVVHQLEQALLAHILSRYLSSLKRVLSCSSSFHVRKYFSSVPIGAVLQAFGVVAREDELHGGEERLVELRLLVGEVLADAVANRHAAVLQLHHADGDAVDVEHDIGPTLVVAAAA